MTATRGLATLSRVHKMAQKLANETGKAHVIWRVVDRFFVLAAGQIKRGAEQIETVMPEPKPKGA